MRMKALALKQVLFASPNAVNDDLEKKLLSVSGVEQTQSLEGLLSRDSKPSYFYSSWLIRLHQGFLIFRNPSCPKWLTFPSLKALEINPEVL